MVRVWHPYWLWEDWKAGMWRKVSADERKSMLKKAIEFTGNHELYGQYMLRAVREWPIACEHNLTEEAMNRLAWIGHAATCIAIDCPEDITRQAWGYLTQQQRDDANRQAEIALNEWMRTYERQDSQLCLELGATGL